MDDDEGGFFTPMHGELARKWRKACVNEARRKKRRLRIMKRFKFIANVRDINRGCMNDGRCPMRIAVRLIIAIIIVMCGLPWWYYQESSFCDEPNVYGGSDGMDVSIEIIPDVCKKNQTNASVASFAVWAFSVIGLAVLYGHVKSVRA